MRFLASKCWWQRVASVAIGGAMAWTVPALAQKTELLVYTALETDQIKAYEEAFYKAVPDVTLKWVRDSTGVITAKVIAEKANPQADLVVGTSASSLAVFANEGMLQGYAPKGLDKITPAYRDPKNPPEWVGMDVYGAAVCFNTVAAAKLNLPKPASCKSLTKPVHKGKIVFPTEGLGWDLEASGIMKTTKKVDAARKLMDWLATPDAMALFSNNFAVLAVPGIAKPLDYIPADYEKRLVKNDFAWSAKNRDR